jgi:integrase
MPGSMRERRTGVWELIVQLPRDPTTGRVRQISRTVHGNKRDAQRALSSLVTEVSAGKATTGTQSVAELLDSWLELVGERLSPTTTREYRRLIETMLKPVLGNISLRRLTAQRLDAYYSGLVRDRGLSPGTVRHAHAVMCGALGQAVKWGWLTSNPAEKASPPKVHKTRITPPGLTDTRALLLAADQHDPEFGALLRVLAATGGRRGEICGLRWSDVDFDAGTLLISRSIASVAGGIVEKDTKTHASRRISLDAETLNELGRQRQRLEERATLCDADLARDCFVFTHAVDGSRPLHPDTITGGFRRLCTKLGIKGVRLHDLRHLHATQLLAAGVPVSTVSGRLGHANSSTTLNVYAHFLAASDRRAADVIGGLLRADVVGHDSLDPSD